MVHQKNILEEALEQLDFLRAIGEESRREAKARLCGSDVRHWSVSTGKIYSHITRQVYQQHMLLFINWARDTFEMKRLQALDDQAEHLVVVYLQTAIEAYKSSFTLQAKRSAFRLITFWEQHWETVLNLFVQRDAVVQISYILRSQ